jgi:hypothetical protein
MTAEEWRMARPWSFEVLKVTQRSRKGHAKVTQRSRKGHARNDVLLLTHYFLVNRQRGAAVTILIQQLNPTTSVVCLYKQANVMGIKFLRNSYRFTIRLRLF